MAPLSVCALVLLLSVVQSIFGVGLLVFGTPSLLLLGYSFPDALRLLLPCSLFISFLQVSGDWKNTNLRREFATYCLPGVVVCLSATLFLKHPFNIKFGVGILMLSTAVIRSSEQLKTTLQRFSVRHTRAALLLVGMLHGLTNMGGGLLSILVSAIYRQKAKIRANIAYGYLLMASCQLLVLLVSRKTNFDWNAVVLPAIASATYLLIGNKLFALSSENQYQRVLTGFISIFGIVLLLG